MYKYILKIYEINALAACKPGFFGLSCNKSCPPGAFGKRCGGVCWNCSVDDCDNVYGCVETIGKTHEGKVYRKRICLYEIHCVNIYFIIIP